MEYEEQYPGISNSSGTIGLGGFDSTWYQVNSWGMDWLNNTCAINADCNGESTQCCASILITDPEGWEEQTFRCMSAAGMEVNVEQLHQMDDGT